MSRRILVVAAVLTVLGLGIAKPAHADSVYIVTRGDNLYRIALRYGTTVQAVMRANGLRSPDVIYVGQRLVVPDSGSPYTAPARSAPPASGARSGGVHIVAPGETLARIASRYGTTVSALVLANGLRSADFIYAGQRLAVPGAAPAAPVGGAPAPAPVIGGGAGRRIVIDLSSQRLTAYENGRAVTSFVISSGKASTPTPIGSFRIYARYRSQTMSGPGYYLPGVPYVQYFAGGNAIHGAYWHNMFGTPTSHGCVNLREGDAGWLWSWASIGTPVIVQW
jgi:lipoprotein-anchoring transpeptidase ErfK/SrfK